MKRFYSKYYGADIRITYHAYHGVPNGVPFTYMILPLDAVIILGLRYCCGVGSRWVLLMQPLRLRQ